MRYGQPFASIGTIEKGMMGVHIEVSSPGGHPVYPPPHTSIGMLSSLLVELEAHPYNVEFKRDTPAYQEMQCLAAHAPEMPESLRELIRDSAQSDEALKEAEKILFESVPFKATLGTTQAIDLISGGVKINALPESAWAAIDHRIAIDRYNLRIFTSHAD